MNEILRNPMSEENADNCEAFQAAFSAYLDSAMSGLQMVALQAHLESCSLCAEEFAVWRDVQRSLGDLGPAQAPFDLQAKLRRTLTEERSKGSYLPWSQQIRRAWRATFAPFAYRLSGGLASALLLVGSMAWLFAAPIAVQANDDKLADLDPPRFLYSQVPQQPFATQRDSPIVVEALIDEKGRVYDYEILEGPKDQRVQVQVADNLLTSIFKPASVFGVPVRGHVLMTYTGVSVRG
jgi:hypothetical protein